MTLTVRSHSQPISVGADLTRSGALARAVRWQPALGAMLIVATVLAWRSDDLADLGAATNMLRGVALLLSLGVLFVLDDRSAALVEAVPLRLALRLGLRLLIAAALGGIGFGAAVLVVRAASVDASPSIIGGVAVELLATMLFGLAVAAIAARYWAVDEPGILAAPTVLGLWMALQLLPERWAVLVAPGPQWAEAHLRWAVLLVVSAAAIAVAARDRAARGRPSPLAAQPLPLADAGGSSQHTGPAHNIGSDDFCFILAARRLGPVPRARPPQSRESHGSSIAADYADPARSGS